MQEIILVLSFGILTGLSIGRRMAIKEIEIIAKQTKAGLTTKNSVWRSVRYNLRMWKSIRDHGSTNRSWINVKNAVNSYDSRALGLWYELRAGQTRKKSRIECDYLIN